MWLLLRKPPIFLVSFEKESPLAGAERERLSVLQNCTPGACVILANWGDPNESNNKKYINKREGLSCMWKALSGEHQGPHWACAWRSTLRPGHALSRQGRILGER